MDLDPPRPAGHPGIVTEWRTDRGARIVVLVDRSLPLVATSLRVATGSADAPRRRCGLAHLVEHLSLAAGAGRGDRSPDDHRRWVEELGGYANATTGADFTVYHHLVSPDLLDRLLATEAERLAGGVEHADEAALEQERRVVLTERRQRVDATPYGDARERLAVALFPESSPYHRPAIGLPDDLASVTLADCRTFWRDSYRAPRVSLAVAGDVDPDRIGDRVAAMLAAFPAGDPVAASAAPVPDPVTSRLCVPSAFGPKVYLGLLLPREGTWEFELARFASYCVGVGRGSPLARRLVGRGLAAAVDLRVFGHCRDRSLGVVEFVPADGVAPDRLVAGFDEEMTDLLSGALSGRDVAHGAAAYRSRWLAGDDSLHALADSLSRALHLSTVTDYLGHLDRVAGLSRDDVVTALRWWHRPGQRTELVYGS